MEARLTRAGGGSVPQDDEANAADAAVIVARMFNNRHHIFSKVVPFVNAQLKTRVVIRQ